MFGGGKRREAQERATYDARDEAYRKLKRCVSGQRRWRLEAEATSDASYRGQCLEHAGNYEIAEPRIVRAIEALQDHHRPDLATARSELAAVQTLYNSRGQQYLVRSLAGLEFNEPTVTISDLFSGWG